MHQSPNRYALKLFKWFCKKEYHLDIEGDLIEHFENRLETKGEYYAQLMLLLDVLLLFRPSLLKSFTIFPSIKHPTMIKHNLLISWRILKKNKIYSIINVAGLGLGMAVAMLISLWIKDEINFDGFHDKLDQLAIVKRHVYTGTQVMETSEYVTWNIAEVLKNDYPEVEDVTIITGTQNLVVRIDDRPFREKGIFATPSFFDMFSWNLIQGNSKKLLDTPNSIVISSTLAKKYFGPDAIEQGEVVGQTIDHNFNGFPPLKVSGVFEDFNSQSSLQFDFVMPMIVYQQRNSWLTNWNNSGIRIFAQIADGTDLEVLSQKIVDVQNEHIDDFRSDLFLQAYSDHHLHSNYKDGLQAGGRIQYVKIFALIAIFLILIASINFMNLSTASSLQRLKEIQVRKAIGAERKMLISQFLSESFFLIIISFLLSLSLVLLALPLFNNIAGKSLTINELGRDSITIFLAIGMITTLLASIYPALYLSSFYPARKIQASTKKLFGHANIRQSLVVFQFIMSISLIVGALTIFQQIKYIQSKNLGLDKENVVFLRLDGDLRNNYSSLKEELLRSPAIQAVTTSNESPIDISSNTHSVNWQTKDPTNQVSFRIIDVNFDFIDVMKMELIEGRNFDQDFGTDSTNFIINEAALKIMGFEDPIGQRLNFWGRTGIIVGMVKDFHMASLHTTIEPAIIRLRPRSTSRLFLRTESGRTEEAIATLQGVYKRINPDYPFQYEFLDESFQESYENEQTVSTLSYYFTLFALFIACLGLIGLAVYTGQRRLKEVSIRKVLGASLSNLIILLSRDFLILVLIAFLIASPLAYYLVQGWLDNFAYRINIGIGLFLIAGGATLLVTLCTVGFYAAKIAISNPVEALKSE